LVDPAEQRQRFIDTNEERQQLGKRPYTLPEPFLNDLLKMPPATGSALGVDRLVMLLADTDCIDEVVAFVPESL
jgi:lysyl-tRNA synthetase class 2